ncbi:MAG: spermidine synthase [Planctomycetota bacterium]|jgi:spermidine synthase
MQQTLYSGRSKYQRIDLTGDGRRIVLRLDDYFQFDSKSERVYHEFLALLPMMFSTEAARVLILGGGDGLALREVLRNPSATATMVELDGEVLALASRGPVAALNEGSLSNPRANVVTGDARKVLPTLPDGSFDVIVMDFPAATNPELATLYDLPFLTEVLSKLARGGVYVSQISEGVAANDDMVRLLTRVLGHGMGIFTAAGADRESFAYGARQPFAVRRQLAGTYVTGATAGEIARRYRAGKKRFVFRANPTRRTIRMLSGTEQSPIGTYAGLAILAAIGYAFYRRR